MRNAYVPNWVSSLACACTLLGAATPVLASTAVIGNPTIPSVNATNPPTGNAPNVIVQPLGLPQDANGNTLVTGTGRQVGTAIIGLNPVGPDTLTITSSNQPPNTVMTVFLTLDQTLGDLPGQFLGTFTTDSLGNGVFSVTTEVSNAYAAQDGNGRTVNPALASGALANGTTSVPLPFIRTYIGSGNIGIFGVRPNPKGDPALAAGANLLTSRTAFAVLDPTVCNVQPIPSAFAPNQASVTLAFYDANNNSTGLRSLNTTTAGGCSYAGRFSIPANSVGYAVIGQNSARNIVWYGDDNGDSVIDQTPHTQNTNATVNPNFPLLRLGFAVPGNTTSSFTFTLNGNTRALTIAN